VTVQHPHAELSAYIDEALAPADRAVVEAHVDACAVCRAHVAQLRATTALVRALPDPIPSRHLVPRLGVPAWMAPLRTLMTLASGTAVFLFIASSLASNITFLAGGAPTTASSRDARPEAAAAPGAAQDTRLRAPTQVPGPSQQTAFAVTPTGSPSVDGGRALAPSATGDAAKRLEDSAAPPAPGEATTADGRSVATTSQPGPSPLLSPWLWLGIAILSGAFAIALHRRLHSTA
jgi:anti-sigma factor RsiW